MKPVLAAALLVMTTGAVPAQTQAEMTRQADADWKAADAAMTKAWNTTYAAMKRRDGEDAPGSGAGFGFAAAALESQRAWLSFRDKQCVIEGAEFAGGSMQPMAQALCLARLTGERTKQLAAMQWR